MMRTLWRAWRYLAAALDGKLDELLDPAVQVEQAIDEARRRHVLLAEQAAAVVGSEREIEIRIRRTEDEVDRLRESAGQALVLAKRARDSGNETGAASYERTARAFAAQLTSAEATLGDLEELHDKAHAASVAARRGLEQNSFALQQQMTERTRMLSELEAAKLQERMADAMRQIGQVTAKSAVPSIADVRERIDRRFALATGRGELAAENIDARMLDVRRAALDVESDRRLEEIRKSLGLAAPPSTGAGG